jgi:hypothetical protein
MENSSDLRTKIRPGLRGDHGSTLGPTLDPGADGLPIARSCGVSACMLEEGPDRRCQLAAALGRQFWIGRDAVEQVLEGLKARYRIEGHGMVPRQ